MRRVWVDNRADKSHADIIHTADSCSCCSKSESAANAADCHMMDIRGTPARSVAARSTTTATVSAYRNSGNVVWSARGGGDMRFPDADLQAYLQEGVAAATAAASSLHTGMPDVAPAAVAGTPRPSPPMHAIDYERSLLSRGWDETHSECVLFPSLSPSGRFERLHLQHHRRGVYPHNHFIDRHDQRSPFSVSGHTDDAATALHPRPYRQHQQQLNLQHEDASPLSQRTEAELSHCSPLWHQCAWDDLPSQPCPSQETHLPGPSWTPVTYPEDQSCSTWSNPKRCAYASARSPPAVATTSEFTPASTVVGTAATRSVTPTITGNATDIALEPTELTTDPQSHHTCGDMLSDSSFHSKDTHAYTAPFEHETITNTSITTVITKSEKCTMLMPKPLKTSRSDTTTTLVIPKAIHAVPVRLLEYRSIQWLTETMTDLNVTRLAHHKVTSSAKPVCISTESGIHNSYTRKRKRCLDS